MKVLVTGHLGYIGTVLTPVLSKAGHEVVGCDNDLYKACAFNVGGRIESVPALEKDIRDLTVDDLSGFDAVIHLAALSNDPLGRINPEFTFSVNHHGSVHLAKAAKLAGVSRFVMASSCSNYGDAGDDMIDETGALNPLTPYGQSKIWSERDIAPLTDERFAPVFLRPATTFGVSPRMRFDIILNNLVGCAFTKGMICLKSDGTAWRPIIHVEDLARAFLGALEAPTELVAGEAFNVGSNAQNYRIRDLAQIVARVVPGCTLEFAPDSGPDKRSYRISFEKFERLLPDFRTEWDVRRGAEQLYESYSASDLTREQFELLCAQRIGEAQLEPAASLADVDLASTRSNISWAALAS